MGVGVDVYKASIITIDITIDGNSDCILLYTVAEWKMTQTIDRTIYIPNK